MKFTFESAENASSSSSDGQNNNTTKAQTIVFAPLSRFGSFSFEQPSNSYPSTWSNNHLSRSMNDENVPNINSSGIQVSQSQKSLSKVSITSFRSNSQNATCVRQEHATSGDPIQTTQERDVTLTKRMNSLALRNSSNGINTILPAQPEVLSAAAQTMSAKTKRKVISPYKPTKSNGQFILPDCRTNQTLSTDLTVNGTIKNDNNNNHLKSLAKSVDSITNSANNSHGYSSLRHSAPVPTSPCQSHNVPPPPSKKTSLAKQLEMAPNSKTGDITPPVTPPRDDDSKSLVEYNIKNVVCKSNLLRGMVFALLGRRFRRPRAEIAFAIKENGGKVSEKITAKVTHMLCMGDEYSAKFCKAKERGVVILSENQFFDMVANPALFSTLLQSATTVTVSDNKEVTEQINSNKTEIKNSVSITTPSQNNRTLVRSNSASVLNLIHSCNTEIKPEGCITSLDQKSSGNDQVMPIEIYDNVNLISDTEANLAAVLLSLSETIGPKK